MEIYKNYVVGTFGDYYGVRVKVGFRGFFRVFEGRVRWWEKVLMFREGSRGCSSMDSWYFCWG